MYKERPHISVSCGDVGWRAPHQADRIAMESGEKITAGAPVAASYFDVHMREKSWDDLMPRHDGT
jgi:hypothetical protein